MDLRERMKARAQKLSGQKWYEIRAEADTATVRIYDEIGYWGVTADQFARDVAAITTDKIEVQINSPGGDVFDGLAIYNTLRMHPAHVTTRVDGLAASAASIISQAGDHRVIVESAQLMIHEAWGVAVGPASELRDFADLLEQQNKVLAGIYASRSGGDVDVFLGLMSDETWLTDQAAVDLGLADEVFVPEPASAPAAAFTGTVTAASVPVFSATSASASGYIAVTPQASEEIEAVVPPEILRDVWALDHPAP